MLNPQWNLLFCLTGLLFRVQYSICEPPPAPRNFIPVIVNERDASFSWVRITGYSLPIYQYHLIISLVTDDTTIVEQPWQTVLVRGSDTSATVYGLLPGQQYMCSLYAVVLSKSDSIGRSTEIKINTVPGVSSKVLDLKLIDVQSDLAMMNWRTPATPQGVLKYIFVRYKLNTSKVYTTETLSGEAKRITLTKLQFCQNYTVTVVPFTEPNENGRGGGEGEASSLSFSTPSGIIFMSNPVYVTNIARGTQTVRLEPLSTKCRVTYEIEQNPGITVILPKNVYNYTFHNLENFQLYTYKVRPVALPENRKGVFSKPVSLKTFSITPLQPSNFKVTQDESRNINASWNEPLQETGTINSYKLVIAAINVPLIPKVTIETGSAVTFVQQKNLQACVNYTLTVQARVLSAGGDGLGDKATANITMSTLVIHVKEKPFVSNIDATTYGIRWPIEKTYCNVEYIVEYKEQDNNSSQSRFITLPAVNRLHPIRNLQPRVLYRFRVKAVSSPGKIEGSFSPWSDRIEPYVKTKCPADKKTLCSPLAECTLAPFGELTRAGFDYVCTCPLFFRHPPWMPALGEGFSCVPSVGLIALVIVPFVVLLTCLSLIIVVCWSAIVNKIETKRHEMMMVIKAKISEEHNYSDPNYNISASGSEKDTESFDKGEFAISSKQV